MPIDETVTDGVRVLSMRQGKVNAMDLALVEEISQSLAVDDPLPIVLTGDGKIFSAGIDLLALVRGGPEYIREYLPKLSEFFERLLTYPRPVVAAINGHAVAGGCVAALACDQRIATEGRFTMRLPAVRIGVPYPVLAVELLRETLPFSIFQQMILSADSLSGEQCLTHRLVHQRVPEQMVLEKAICCARELGQIPTAAFAISKAQRNSTILSRARQAAPPNDPHFVDAWLEPRVQRLLQEYVESTLKSS